MKCGKDRCQCYKCILGLSITMVLVFFIGYYARACFAS